MSMPLKRILESLKNMQAETITNENGTAIKFSDGTMICTLNTTVTDQAINRAYGSLYWGSRNWTYPAAFIEKPVVDCSIFKWGTGVGWGNIIEVTNTYATLVGIDILSRETGTNVNIQATAIGRWK